MMHIALIAENLRKELMVQFCIAYCGILARHSLYATSTTGKYVSAATGLDLFQFLGASEGGSEQIISRISCNELDVILYFADPFVSNRPKTKNNIIHACDIHNIPVATNIATAEVLIRGLDRGDLDWRNIVNSRTSQTHQIKKREEKYRSR